MRTSAHQVPVALGGHHGKMLAEHEVGELGLGVGESERGDQLASTLAASLTARPVLCDLISTQAAVLEHNVSPHVAAQYKRAAILVTGAVWTHARPAAAMLAAYEADPSLASMRLDFTTTLREILQVLITGLLARPSR
jgi:hypothetical protein